jgi:hypothetical protein
MTESENPAAIAHATAVSTQLTRREDLSLQVIEELMDKSKKLSLVWWPGAIISLAISSWGVFFWRGYWPWEPPPGGIEGVFIDAVLSMLVIGGTCGAVVGGLYAMSRKMLTAHARELGLEDGLAKKVVARMASAPKPRLGTSPAEAMRTHLLNDPEG